MNLLKLFLSFLLGKEIKLHTLDGVSRYRLYNVTSVQKMNEPETLTITLVRRQPKLRQRAMPELTANWEEMFLDIDERESEDDD